MKSQKCERCELRRSIDIDSKRLDALAYICKVADDELRDLDRSIDTNSKRLDTLEGNHRVTVLTERWENLRKFVGGGREGSMAGGPYFCAFESVLREMLALERIDE